MNTDLFRKRDGLHLIIIVVVNKFPIVGSQSFELPGENVLLHLHRLAPVGQAADLADVGVAGQEVGDVVCDQLGGLEDGVAVHTAPALLQIKHLLPEVLRASPRGRQEDDVRLQGWQNFEKITNNELNPVLDSVDGGVMTSLLNLVRINVDGDHSLASEGELNGVASNTAKSVDDQVTPTTYNTITNERNETFKMFKLITCIGQQCAALFSPG